MNPFELKGKTALVTGGGVGIGLGISKSLLASGARVIICGRNEETLKDAVSLLGENSNYEVFDLQNQKAIPDFIQSLEKKYGSLHILVNNAGIHLKKYAEDTTDEEFENIIRTNLLSTFSLTREAAKTMKKRQSGSIVFISSMAGLFGIDRVSAYGTSKTALIGLMQNLVTEYSKDNIRINTIAPGWIASDMFFKAVEADPTRKEKIVNRIAMNGFGTTEDIGNAVVFLSSPAAKYITGVTLPVDGGAAVNF